jgi:hypothetical protein
MFCAHSAHNHFTFKTLKGTYTAHSYLQTFYNYPESNFYTRDLQEVF